MKGLQNRFPVIKEYLEPLGAGQIAQLKIPTFNYWSEWPFATALLDALTRCGMKDFCRIQNAYACHRAIPALIKRHYSVPSKAASIVIDYSLWSSPEIDEVRKLSESFSVPVLALVRYPLKSDTDTPDVEMSIDFAHTDIIAVGPTTIKRVHLSSGLYSAILHRDGILPWQVPSGANGKCPCGADAYLGFLDTKCSNIACENFEEVACSQPTS